MNLVIQKKGKEITTSHMIAKVFIKRHADVLRAIRNLECSKEFNQLNFAPVKIKDKKGEYNRSK